MIKEKQTNKNPHMKTKHFNLKIFNKQERGIVLQKCKYSYYRTLTFSDATSAWSYKYGLTYISEKCFLYVNLDLPVAFKVITLFQICSSSLSQNKIQNRWNG